MRCAIQDDFSVEQVLTLQSELAERWWGSNCRPHSRSVAKQIRKNAESKQAILHGAMAKLRDPALHTPETLPLTWPLFEMVKNPSSQMVAALRALLYSSSVAAVCDDNTEISTPHDLLKWVEWWEPALKYFAKRGLLEYPKPHDAWGRLLDVIYDSEADCLEFLSAGAERRLEIADQSGFTDEASVMLVDPIKGWIRAMHDLAITTFRKAHADKDVKELHARRGNWLPVKPKESRRPEFEGEIVQELVKFNVTTRELFYNRKRVSSLKTTMSYFLAVIASGELIPAEMEVGPARAGVKRRATALSAYTMLCKCVGKSMASALVRRDRGLGFSRGAARYVSGDRGHANSEALGLVADTGYPDPSEID